MIELLVRQILNQIIPKKQLNKHSDLLAIVEMIYQIDFGKPLTHISNIIFCHNFSTFKVFLSKLNNLISCRPNIPQNKAPSYFSPHVWNFSMQAMWYLTTMILGRCRKYRAKMSNNLNHFHHITCETLQQNIT